MLKGTKATWTAEERAERCRSISAGMKTGAPAVSEEEKGRRAAAISAGIIALGFTQLEMTHRIKEDIQLRCPAGHVFSRSFQYLQRSPGCPGCLSLQEVRRRQVELELRLEGTGVQLSAPVVPKVHRAQLRCQYGHEFSRKIHHIVHNPVVCDACTREERKRIVQETAAKNGVEVVEYDGAYMDVVVAKCPKDHEIRVLYQGIEQGLWCVTCNGYFAEDDFARQIEAIVGRPLVRNSRTLIAPAELDIFDPVTKIAIEYCGLYYHSNAISNNVPSQHADKLKACQDKGIRLLTVFEDEWLEKPSMVLDLIRHAFGAATHLEARDLVVREVDATTAAAFFDAHSLHGATSCVYAEGLYDGDSLVQCMALGRDGYLGLVSLPELSVQGGVARLCVLLAAWAKENGYQAIQVRQDLRHGTGSDYEALGFSLVSTSPPSCWYVKRNRRYPSEHPGYYRIWDCGHQTWEFAI